MKIAVVLFNLGGPDSADAVRPFLRNLFDDPAIIGLPAVVRRPLSWFVAKRRAPIAREIYAQIGGRSPIVEETEAQAAALEAALNASGHTAKCFIAMRYWHPMTRETAAAVKAWTPEKIVLLPLYPQFSTTTTDSSLNAWDAAARKLHLNVPRAQVCCYPSDRGFIEAVADLLAGALGQRKPGIAYRVLFSAHGLPENIIKNGDPYRWQVEESVAAVVKKLAHADLDSQVCFQSRVGPLKWIGPSTDGEIARAGAAGKALIVVPIAFVSEHSETLVELDIEYRRLAEDHGVPDYIRVGTVRTHPAFIKGLADLTLRALIENHAISCAVRRICPSGMRCANERAN